MRRSPRVTCALAVASLIAVASCGQASGGGGGRTLRVSGSTTVNPIAADAAQALREEGIRLSVDTQGGSAGGIAQLAAGQVDVAMSSRPLDEEERRAHPALNFVVTAVGQDAVGVIVRREVFDGGVRSLNREQLRALFEGRLSSWRQLGGPDLPVFVYDKEPGRGTREVLDAYLYGKGAKPPPPAAANYAVVGGNEETRAKLESTPGAVGPLSVAFVTGRSRLVAVAVDGVQPVPERVKDKTYPLARPLLLITNGPPQGSARRFIDYVLSENGQELVRRHGYLRLADLGEL